MRLLEFFEDESGRLSMGRLILFLGFVAVTYGVFFKMKLTINILGLYIGLITGTFMTSKGLDALTAVILAKINAVGTVKT